MTSIATALNARINDSNFGHHRELPVVLDYAARAIAQDFRHDTQGETEVRELLEDLVQLDVADFFDAEELKAAVDNAAAALTEDGWVAR